jgi:hypothetical protein
MKCCHGLLTRLLRAIIDKCAMRSPDEKDTFDTFTSEEIFHLLELCILGEIADPQSVSGLSRLAWWAHNRTRLSLRGWIG